MGRPLLRRRAARPPRPPTRQTRRSEPMAAGAALFLVVMGRWSRATCTSIGKSFAGYPALPVRCLSLSKHGTRSHVWARKWWVELLALLDNLCLTRYHPEHFPCDLSWQEWRIFVTSI